MLLKKRYKIILFFLFVSYNSVAKDMPIAEIRAKIEQATFDEEVNLQLIKDLEEIDNRSALQTAFLGTAEAILCTHIVNPSKRLKHLKSASMYVNEAVTQEPKNIEIRFMRFAIESHVPKFLGYSKHLDEDSSFLRSNFKQPYINNIPYRSLEEMLHVIDESKLFTSSELIAMRAEVYGLKDK